METSTFLHPYASGQTTTDGTARVAPVRAAPDAARNPATDEETEV